MKLRILGLWCCGLWFGLVGSSCSRPEDSSNDVDPSSNDGQAGSGRTTTRREQPARGLQIRAGDTLAIIGNTFAEQMRRYGYFETFLHSRFPKHRLRIRNLGWSADEVGLQPRPAGFSDVHRDLQQIGADVVIACFGMNESFRGRAGLPRFRTELARFVVELAKHQYNGTSAPRIALVSPIAHENLGGGLPDGKARNAILKLYTAAMAEVAQQHRVRFVDLFAPTSARIQTSPEQKLTDDGIHLHRYGYWVTSRLLAEALGLLDKGLLNKGLSGKDASPTPALAVARLRRAVFDKNRVFFQRWRGPNSEYIDGSKRRSGGAEGLAEERAWLLKLLGKLDALVWTVPKPDPSAIFATAPAGRPLWTRPAAHLGLGLGPIGTSTDQPTRQHAVPSPAESLASFILPDGYRANLFASEEKSPIANPIAMAFDARGRLWVANTPSWPQPIPGQAPRDSIIILEDKDGDGAADGYTVFADHLGPIHGFAVGHGGAFIAQTPDLIFAADTDGDLRADRFETVLHGFGNEVSAHSINNFTWGPGGALYFMEGAALHTQVETPYGPRRVRDGGLFRFDPRTRRFDVLASYSFVKPFGQIFGRYGEQVVLDAATHDYFDASALSAPFRYPKKKARQHSRLSFAPKGLGPAAGLGTVPDSGHFPVAAQGRLLVNQFAKGFRGTRWLTLSKRGSGLQAVEDETPLLLSTDARFRPIAMAGGPDGALYILDFASGLVEETATPKRASGLDHTHGRVWRITYPARPLTIRPPIDGQSLGDLLELLKSKHQSTRDLARRALQEQDPQQVKPLLVAWIEAAGKNDPWLLAALWVQQGLGIVDADLLSRLMAAQDQAIRAAATRVLRLVRGAGSRFQAPFDAPLALRVEDTDPSVRLEAVLALGIQPSISAHATALRVANWPMDAGLRYALDETLDFIEQRYPELRHRLPKSALGYRFALSRMSAHDLLERPGDEPVWTEIATRRGLGPQRRRNALAELARIRNTDPTAQTLAFVRITAALREDGADALADLVALLPARPVAELVKIRPELIALTRPDHTAAVRQAGFASLLATGLDIATVRDLTSETPAAMIDLLRSCRLVPLDRRAELHEELRSLALNHPDLAVARAATLAIAHVPGSPGMTFNTICATIHREPEYGFEALLEFRAEHWVREIIAALSEELLPSLTEAPERDRAKPAFRRELRLGYEFASMLPATEGRELRSRLRQLGTRSLTIRTIPNRRLFDKAVIPVAPSETIELVVQNPDTIDHNFVIVKPGQLATVGAAADRWIGFVQGDAQQFVPVTDDVLLASPIIRPRCSVTLAFTAPSTPGDYPFLCTTQGHWSMMHGVIRVTASEEVRVAHTEVPDLVRSWRPDDVPHILKKHGTGDPVRGKRWFGKLCASCHALGVTVKSTVKSTVGSTAGNPGHAVGPDLTQATERLSPAQMLEHIIAPSQQISARYQNNRVELRSGEVLFGRVEKAGNRLAVFERPLAKTPSRVIPTDRVAAVTPTRQSTMPSGLLDTLRRRQIIDLLAFIRGREQ